MAGSTRYSLPGKRFSLPHHYKCHMPSTTMITRADWFPRSGMTSEDVPAATGDCSSAFSKSSISSSILPTCSTDISSCSSLNIQVLERTRAMGIPIYQQSNSEDSFLEKESQHFSYSRKFLTQKEDDHYMNVSTTEPVTGLYQFVAFASNNFNYYVFG